MTACEISFFFTMDRLIKTSFTTFNSKGRLSQIEFAKKTVSYSNTLIGVKTQNGTIVALKTNKEMNFELPFFSSKIFIINKKIGISGSGLSQDIRILIKRARRHAEIYKYNFGGDISLRQLVKDMASFIQEFTHSGGVRPFGASIMLLGFETEGPNLYQIEPSGIFLKIKTNSLGIKSNEIKNFIKKRKIKKFNIREGCELILKTLEKISENKITEKNLQFAYVNYLCVFKIMRSIEVFKLIKKKSI